MSRMMILAGWITLFASNSVAQTEGISDSVQLKEVVVASFKFNILEKETAHPVQIIPASTIDQSQGKDLAQILQEQAGISINGAYNNPGSVKGVYLRGASSEFTLILIDGIPAFDPSGLGEAFDFRVLQLIKSRESRY